MKRVLQYFAVGVTLFVCLLVALGFVVLEWPNIIANQRLITFASKYSERFTGMRVNWEQLRTKTVSRSFFEKQIEIGLHRFCATSLEKSKEEKPVLAACFDDVDVALAYSFKSVLPKLVELGPVKIIGGVADTYPPKVKKKTNIPSIPSWVKSATLEPIFVQLNRADVHSDSGVLAASALVQGERGRFLATSNATMKSSTTAIYAQSRMAVQTQSGKIGGPWLASGSAKVNVPSYEANATTDFRLAPREQAPAKPGSFDYEANVDANSKWGKSKINTHGNFSLEGDWLRGVLAQDIWPTLSKSAEVANLSQFKHVAVRDCSYSYGKTSSDKTSASLDCPVYLDLPQSKKQGGRGLAQALEFRRHPLIKIVANFLTAYPAKSSKQVSGYISVEPDQLLSNVVRNSGGTRLDLAFVPDKLPAFDKFDGKVDFRAVIPRFEKLVADLTQTPFAIPAPLQALRGPAQARALGSFNLSGGNVNAKLTTNLRSLKGSQRLAIIGKARVLARKLQAGNMLVAANVDANLVDVKITLPKLSVTSSSPQVLPDARLMSEHVNRSIASSSNKSKSVEVKYSVRVHTEKPVALASQFTPQPVPIELDLTATQVKPMSGTVDIKRFPMKLLGINKGVGSVHLDLDAANRNGILMGQIQMIDPGSQNAGQTVQIPPPQLTQQAAGEAAESRAGPKLFIPATEIASSLLAGTTVSAVSQQPGMQTQQGGALEERDQTGILQFRRRY